MTVTRSCVVVIRRLWCILLLAFAGCNPLYQSYSFTETMQTTLPVKVSGDEVWVTSIPVGADVYVQPFVRNQTPSHATDPEAYHGKTPVSFSLSPGSYWIELAFDVEVFDNYFTRPYDDAQFEQDGAASEALLFKPLAPGAKRRVLRYYQVEKRQQEGLTLIALFYPRGEPSDRVIALYPQQQQYQFVPAELLDIMRRAEVPESAQEAFLDAMRRGGKAFWSRRDEHRVALELEPEGVKGQIITLYTGTPLPDPLIPDGGGL